MSSPRTSRSADSEAWSLALRRLSRRECSALEIERYLSRKEISDEVISETIRRLVREGLLDDRRFARMLVREQALRGKGPIAIAHKLKAKGISLDVSEVRRISSEVSDVDEVERARRIVERRYPGAAEDEKTRVRAFRALMNRGFTSEIARKVIFELSLQSGPARNTFKKNK